MQRVALCFAFMAILACANGHRTLLQNDGSSSGGDSSSPPPPPPMNVTSPPPPPPPQSTPPPPPPSGTTPPPPTSSSESTPPPPPSSSESTPPPPPPSGNQNQGQTITFSPPSQENQGNQGQQDQTQRISFPAPSTEGGQGGQSGQAPSTEGGGQVSPQLQDQETNVISNLPSDIVPGGTTVDTAVVQDVNSSLQQHVNDPSSGAEALNSALSSANAVSVSKGFSTAVVSNPSSASSYTNSFAQLCINAANSGDVTYVTKTVASFSLSVVFLVVTGNVAVAKTCASAFTSYIVSAGGCSEFVVIIIQTFIQITVTLTSKTTVNIFG